MLVETTVHLPGPFGTGPRGARGTMMVSRTTFIKDRAKNIKDLPAFLGSIVKIE